MTRQSPHERVIPGWLFRVMLGAGYDIRAGSAILAARITARQKDAR